MDAAQIAVPVVIAAPEPLAHYPSIDAAVLCLRLLRGAASSELVGRLLRSPFLAAGLAESDARASADARLREEQRALWDLSLLERWAGMTNCPQLQIHAARAATLARALPLRQPASQWAEAFNAVLTALGWPGERTLNSIEYQTERKFHAALSELGALDAVLGPCTLQVALREFQTILEYTAFEAESQPAAITVLDADAAAGLHFEALWVLGLDAARLPGAVHPDPFIPLELQRAAHMPQASAQHCLQLAQLRLRRLTSSASSVILSWPQTDGDAHLQASALLAGWPVISASQLRLATARSRARQLFEERPILEHFLDEHAPPLPGAAAKGGTLILELQSRCPFRAQAELRLAARPLASVHLGIGARERGMLLHRVLAQLWSELQSHAQLCAREPQELEPRVRELALQHAPRILRADTPLRARLLQVEIDYTVQQILRLLEIERTRAPFEVRFAEQGCRLSIGGLDIALQPDRIDQLQSGGELLVDYKLGNSHNPNQWLDVWPGRPRRPQLPLYALANAQRVDALAFVVLAPGRVEFRGWSAAPTGTSGIEVYPPRRARIRGPADWPALLEHWQHELALLAGQFLAGHAAVDPLPLECDSCHLRSFCRIHEHAQPLQYDLDFEDE
jgi:probable DNA repair protein